MKKRIISLLFAVIMLMTAFSAFGAPVHAEEAGAAEPAAAAQTEEAAEPALNAQTEMVDGEEPVLTEQATLISEIRLVGLPLPAIGVEPGSLDLTVPAGAHYSINANGARWFNATDGRWMLGGDVFEGGKIYELDICFVPNNGYYFAELKDLEFSIDGVSEDDCISIRITKAWNDMGEQANRTVYVSFNRIPAAAFSDVTDPKLFYYDAVYWAGNKGIVTGWSDGTFRPLNNCNRAAVVTFMWRLGGRPEPEGTAEFTDMTGNPEFDKAISWASEEYIVTGWDDGSFRPWNTCNRAAVVTFLWRWDGRPDPDHTAGYYFSDPTGDSEFDRAIGWAYENQIVTGWDDGTFRPWNTCNRLAIVSFLHRYAQYAGLA